MRQCSVRSCCLTWATATPTISAAVLARPGTSTFLQLRLAADNPVGGFDPITFAVLDSAALADWAKSLDIRTAPSSASTLSRISTRSPLLWP